MNRTGSTDSIVGELAESFLERRRRGERPTVQEYIDRRPDLATEISEIFSALLTVENSVPARTDAPDRIGDYRIVREIGRGGMGVVYEAFHEKLGRAVALKVLAPHLLASDAHRERFLREARAAARLHHTNIVPVHEIGSRDGRDFFAMQLIAGRSLDAHLADLRSDSAAVSTPAGDATPVDSAVPRPQRRESTAVSEPFDWRTVATIGRQAAGALAHAHAHGITHRDVKPSNLLLDEAGDVWLTDFGLAKAADAADNLTASGALLGTLRYMAPEQLDGRVDARSDICSLGLTLYELATFRPAFGGSAHGELIEQIRSSTPASPRRVNPALPRDFETILLKAIAKEPGRRYQSSADLANDLNRLLAGFPIAARQATSFERLALWARRNPVVAGLSASVAVLLVAISVGSVVVAYRQSELRVKASDNETRAIEAADKERQRRQDLKKALENMSSVALAEMTQSGPPTPQQRAFFQAALKQYETIVAEEPDDQAGAIDIANAVSRVAVIQERLGDMDLAKRNYARAAELADALVAGADAPIVNLELAARFHFMKARHLRVLNDLTGARAAGMSSLALWERVAAAPRQEGTLVYRYVEALSLVGGVLLSEGNKAAARAMLERADAAAVSAPLPKGPYEVIRSLVTLSNTGEFAAQLGDTRRARSFRERALNAADWLEQNAIDYADARANVARVAQGAGLQAYKVRDLPAARKHLERSAGHYRALLRHTPADPTSRHELAWNYNIRGHVEHLTDKTQDALLLLSRACEIIAPLVEEFPDHFEYRRDYADILSFRGVTHTKLKQLDQARAANDQAVEQFRVLAVKAPDSVEPLSGVGGALVNRALMEQKADPGSAWLTWMDQAIVDLRRAVEHPRAGPIPKKYLRNAHLTRAAGLHELGRFEEAVTEWDRGIVLNHAEQEAAGLHIRRGLTLERLGRTDDAFNDIDVPSARADLPHEDGLRAARVFSKLSAADGVEENRRETCRRRAVELLTRLHGAGQFRTAAHAKTLTEGEDLTAVRDLPEVQAIIASLRNAPNPP